MPAPWPTSGFSPKASRATRKYSSRPEPQKFLKFPLGLVGNSMSELVNWSQARSPTATPGDQREQRRARSPSRAGPRRRARAPTPGRSACRRRRSSRRRPQKRASATRSRRPGRAGPRRLGRSRRGRAFWATPCGPGRQHRRHRAEHPDPRASQQPEAVVGEGDQADRWRPPAPAGRRASRSGRARSAGPACAPTAIQRKEAFASAGSSRGRGRTRSRRRRRWRSSSRAGSGSANRCRARLRPGNVGQQAACEHQHGDPEQGDPALHRNVDGCGRFARSGTRRRRPRGRPGRGPLR